MFSRPGVLLYFHAEQLQQCREDAHVIEQKDIVSGPVEHIHLSVTFIKHSWGERCEEKHLYINFNRMLWINVTVLHVVPLYTDSKGAFLRHQCSPILCLCVRFG